MKKAFLLPVLAMIFAIGMSFTTVNIDDQAKDYVYLENGSWKSIDQLPCELGSEPCKVQFGNNGPIYQVYDEMNFSTARSNVTGDPYIINP